jgi:hypothetical protein
VKTREVSPIHGYRDVKMAGTIGVFAALVPHQVQPVNMIKDMQLDGKKDKNIIPVVAVVDEMDSWVVSHNA